MSTAFNKGSLTVVSGFSGAGKGTLMKHLLAKYNCYALSVSVTTRQKRPGEREGIDYFYITQEQFDDLVAHNGLLEHAGYVNHCYGTPRRYVEEKMAAGKDVLLEIEVQGARQIKKLIPEAILVFVTPPSAEELRRRLKGRGTESDEVIASRLRQAKEEVKAVDEYDYIIVNDDLDQAVEDLHHTIQAAKNEPLRRRAMIDEIRRELNSLET